MITPGKGLWPHSEDITGVPITVLPPVVFDWTNIPVKNTLFPGTNQGTSSTCQTQAYKLAFKRVLGNDISVEYIYSNIFVPGGGGYLIAPPQWTNANGYALTSKYPDPSPETEANMEARIQVLDIHKLSVLTSTAVISNVNTIDVVAQAILDHDAAIIGIWYTDKGFADSWMVPSYAPNDPSQEGHALCTVNPMIYNGLHAIECETSWYGVEGPDGVCTKHIIDENFFATGGVFELLTLDFKQNNMQLIKDNGTTYLVATDNSFKIGIADLPTLAIFGDEAVSEGSTSAIPQTGTLASGIIYHR